MIGLQDTARFAASRIRAKAPLSLARGSGFLILNFKKTPGGRFEKHYINYTMRFLPNCGKLADKEQNQRIGILTGVYIKVADLLNQQIARFLMFISRPAALAGAASGGVVLQTGAVIHPRYQVPAPVDVFHTPRAPDRP